LSFIEVKMASSRGKKEYDVGFSHGLRANEPREIRPRAKVSRENADFHRLELSDR